MPIFIFNIIYNFFSSFNTKININIRQGYPFWIQKSFKEKIIFYWVNVSYAYAVCN